MDFGCEIEGLVFTQKILGEKIEMALLWSLTPPMEIPLMAVVDMSTSIYPRKTAVLPEILTDCITHHVLLMRLQLA